MIELQCVDCTLLAIAEFNAYNGLISQVTNVDRAAAAEYSYSMMDRATAMKPFRMACRPSALSHATAFSPFWVWSACVLPESHYGTKRWYEPVTGRWLSNDPIGISGGLNQYVFCGGNPVNLTDPMGLLESLLGLDFHASGVIGSGPVGGFQGVVSSEEGVSGIYGYHNLLKNEGLENETYGLDVGVAGQAVFGVGNGPYEGATRSVGLSAGWLTGSVYWSPNALKAIFTGKPGWLGITVGGNFGFPLGAAWERVFSHKLFPKKCP